MRRTFGGWEYGLSPETINNFRQNSPELIIHDVRVLMGLSKEQQNQIRDILLARGVNKWLKARREIIALKHKVRQRIKTSQSKDEKRAYEKILKELKEICHQPRQVEWPREKDPSRADDKFIVKGPRA